MSRIEHTFKTLKAQGRKAFIPYVTAGDPTLPLSRELVEELIQGGADLLELGVPFSDPTADGPVIQGASQRALKAGTTLHDVLSLVEEIRHVSQVPIILFGYYNPFFVAGPKTVSEQCKKAGVDGVLVVDLPYEEADEFKHCADEVGLDFIYLVAPTSGDARIKMITEKARGFLYYISMTGVTGSHQGFDQYMEENITSIRKFNTLPVVIGFGISTPEQAHEMGRVSDGVVVGSALVRIIEQYQYALDLPKRMRQFSEQIKKVL